MLTRRRLASREDRTLVGSRGLPDDAAFDQVSYEITASRLKPGYAENAIISGFLELIGKR